MVRRLVTDGTIHETQALPGEPVTLGIKSTMLRIFSTYPFVSKKLTRESLVQIREARFQALEIFATRSHFDYATKTEVKLIAQALADNRLELLSLHAPTNRDMSVHREGGTPLSITEVERVRRVEAMDELKRVLDVTEDLPYARLIVHMGGSRETADPRKRDAAFSTLENLILHAKHAGVTICVENTTSEMGNPKYLRQFVDETRLTGLRFNFDIGHAHLGEGPEDERVPNSFAPLRELVASAHLHDNHGEKDEHLPPYEGTIDWATAMALFKSGAVKDLPLTIELKEKTGAEAQSTGNFLATAARVLDRLQEDWESN
jgi:sugar phosphate isomerase/epimerase